MNEVEAEEEVMKFEEKKREIEVHERGRKRKREMR